MSTAIIYLTGKGGALAEKLAAIISNTQLYGKNKNDMATETISYDNLSKLITEIFNKYENLIFIMATGIVVRVIAPLLKDKFTDPAVVVLNETGEHVISLLSGHIGGANELTLTIAKELAAIPVITTASDVNNKLAADMLAKKLNLKITSRQQLVKINAEIVAGRSVHYYIDKTIMNYSWYCAEAEKLGLHLDEIDLTNNNMNFPAVLISSNTVVIENTLLLQPANIILGIGCRRNTTINEILYAITEACKIANIHKDNICGIASTTLKEDEEGLIAVAKLLNVKLSFYDNEKISETIKKYNLQESDFVNKKIGVGNVCEAAAILASQQKKLLLRKTKFPKVTIALAVES